MQPRPDTQSHSSLLLAYLADCDVPCPGCGYMLYAFCLSFLRRMPPWWFLLEPMIAFLVETVALLLWIRYGRRTRRATPVTRAWLVLGCWG
jgi:hypothetical protein